MAAPLVPLRRRQAAFDLYARNIRLTEYYIELDGSITTSPASATAETTSETSSLSTTSTDSSSSSSSITSSASLSGASAEVTTGPDGPKTVFQIAHPPQFTKTVSTAYKAPGVNATSKLTSTHIPALITSSSSSSATTTTTSKYKDPAEEAAASAKAPGIPKNELTRCEINGTEADNGPYCSPKHQQNMWVGFTYASRFGENLERLTWNPSLFSDNATNVAELRYVDGALGNAWTSEPVPNYMGYVNVEMSKDWLKGASGNDSESGQNMTLFMMSTPLDGDLDTKPGPQVALVIDPHTFPKVRLKSLPGKYGLEVGVPVGVVGLFLIILGICCGIRKNNRHHRSIRNVSKGYMEKRARRRGRGGDVQLEEFGEDQYRDQPLKGGTGNAFRDEVAKQREEDHASLKRFPSSY
ncbi:uncharacterized protein KY384_003804 [Bacidia gigantensis]|uniref:uncharacterized protein n=1 Tax=Bacidia gigantensis TaxID=2732470 RepID=UPI001D04346C|nr:uncharacterized protein KY384_003804 [Bacidia gigantensis]KAG8532164.1 hypothetical protein KY384_003804 [Bacidia gigantensis]